MKLRTPEDAEKKACEILALYVSLQKQLAELPIPTDDDVVGYEIIIRRMSVLMRQREAVDEVGLDLCRDSKKAVRP